MSNDSGEVFGVMPSKELWRININDSTKVNKIKWIPIYKELWIKYLQMIL